jgi:hypothetical protein
MSQGQSLWIIHSQIVSIEEPEDCVGISNNNTINSYLRRPANKGFLRINKFAEFFVKINLFRILIIEPVHSQFAAPNCSIISAELEKKKLLRVSLFMIICLVYEKTAEIEIDNNAQKMQFDRI